MGSGVTEVDVGYGSICAIKSAALFCWGSNSSGELGTDSGGDPLLTPTAVIGLESGVSAVAVGGRSLSGIGGNSVCVIQSGALVCLGENDSSQLGNGGTGFQAQIQANPTLTSEVTSIALSGAGGCAVKAGQVHCWGARVDPATGVVDLVTGAGSATPVAVSGLPAGTYVTVHGNGAAFCARNADLQEYCWGLNLESALFTGGGTGQAAAPVEAGPFE
jgi:hypothetical protein